MPPGATVITPPNYMNAMGTDICASGTASQVLMANGALAYGQYYGGGIGLNLAQPSAAMAKNEPWNRGNVKGFKFTLTGSNVPTSLRFQVTFYQGAGLSTGDPYCATIGAAGTHTVLLDGTAAAGTDQAALHQACYATPPGGVLPATALLDSIQWQVATNETAATPFNFCVTNLQVVTQ